MYTDYDRNLKTIITTILYKISTPVEFSRLIITIANLALDKC
jgi:hypothetical protein